MRYKIQYKIQKYSVKTNLNVVATLSCVPSLLLKSSNSGQYSSACCRASFSWPLRMSREVAIVRSFYSGSGQTQMSSMKRWVDKVYRGYLCDKKINSFQIARVFQYQINNTSIFRKFYVEGVM